MTAALDPAALSRLQVASLDWREHPASPVIGPPRPSPVVADPTFLPPEDTPDGQWHLFAHSVLGIHQWVSADGIRWTRRPGVVQRNALRAHLVRVDGRFLLTYERTRVFLPVGVPWASWVEQRASIDLLHWSRPRVLLRPEPAWTRRGASRAVGNPCLVAFDGGWRLYVSGGLVRLDDCGFDEPACVGVAEAADPEGPFGWRDGTLLEPDPHDRWANLGAGAVKVLRVADGWVAFQNAIAWDEGAAHSSSSVRVLGSADGLSWTPLGDPFLRPEPGTWRSTHVYALDVRPSRVGLRLYVNGRDGYHWTRGRERIGLFEAALPS